MAGLDIPVELAGAAICTVAGGIWALWGRISGVRSECLKSTSDARAESIRDIRDLHSSTDASMTRVHARVDELQAGMVSKGDLEPLRADIRQMRDQTSTQINTLTADIHKLLTALRG